MFVFAQLKYLQLCLRFLQTMMTFNCHKSVISFLVQSLRNNSPPIYAYVPYRLIELLYGILRHHCMLN